MDSLNNPDNAIRILSLHLLGELKDNQSIPNIVEKANLSENLEVRIAAYKALGTIADKSALDCLIQGLKDSAWQVRAQAARGLGLIGNEKAIEFLEHAMNDTKWWVRRNSAEALTKLGKKGEQVLLGIYKQNPSSDKGKMAAQWLDELGHNPAVC